MNVDVEDIFFPDPRPNAKNERVPHINDVSRMSAYPNGTPVSKILFPRCEEDVLYILKAAHSANKQVGIRGTKHSMGGQSIASQEGWEIDCKYLRQMQYEKDFNRVRCGPGCHWSDLIKILNVHGKSPRTMQSYCSFSIGGTLAVNAHGITTDFCFAESVLEFRLARITAKGEAEAVVCRPRCKGKDNQEQQSSLNSDLFRLALGGYGLFGVITEVVLKVEDNAELELNTMHLKVQPADNLHEDIHPSEFVRIYDNCRNAITDKESSDSPSRLGKVEMKLARLNTINLEKASFYVFRRSYLSPTVSELPAAPRELSTTSRLLYKWAMPLLKDLRYAKEESTGKAIDFDQNSGSSKNQLLFESAVPLSRLYNPLVKKDDTFILQEFFCPHDKFSQWINAVKPIYKDIEMQQKNHKHQLILLNTTIRYVEKDDRTFLSYSRVPGGVFAFVLYYRIQRNEATEKCLGDFHNRLAEVTVSMGGTFYLPYRRCYSQKLLKEAYPMIDEFAEMKELLDPNCLFSNLWFEQYILPICSSAYRTKWENKNSAQASIPLNILQPSKQRKIIHNHEEFLHQLPRREQKDMLRRKNSYRNLLRSKKLRDEFRDQFLVQIFSLANPEEVMSVMTRAAWDPINKYDIHIFEHIRRHFHDPTSENPLDLTSLPRLWRGIQQLRQQKDELTRQTLSIVSKVGMLGEIKNYVCIGDNGKTVKQFVNDLRITGKIWLVHDKVYHDTLPPIAVVLERGSIDRVAHEELAYDYVSDNASKKLSKIPFGSIDMVTMNQGIHHIPPENLFGFLVEILRMLKPGGLFILREHDLELKSAENPSDGKAQYPMLDLAHSVFNAVMGVTIEEEREEIRAFRSILEWRKILESVGFIDTLIYEIEDGDPTWDEMLCFRKPKEDLSSILSIPTDNEIKEVIFEQKREIEEHDEPPIIGLINTLLSQLPELVVSRSSMLLQYLSQGLPKIQNKLTDLLIVVIPYIITQNEEIFGSESRVVAKQVGDIFEPIITGFFKQVLGFVNGSIALLSDSELKERFNFKNIGRTTELYLLLPYLQKKVKLAPNEANQMEKKVVSFIEDYLPSLLPQQFSGQVELPSVNDDHFKDDIAAIDDEVVAATEVQAFVIELGKILPGILNTESILLQSGFSLAQQASLVGQFGGHDLPSACATLANYLDRRHWNILKLKLTTAVTTGDLPTKSLLLGNGPEPHPWNLALKAFFTCPKVILNDKAIFGLRLIGLGEVGSLYREVKMNNEAERVQPCFEILYDNQVASRLKSFDISINQMSKKWTNDIVERTITYSIVGSSQEDCLWDVAEIIQAKFGYSSITSRKVDITTQLQAIHSSIHSNIVNPEYSFHVPDGVHMGFLPIDEALLVQIRNKGSLRRQLGDNFRQSLVNVATLGSAGYNQLEIKYRRVNCQSDRTMSGKDSVQSALDSGHFESLSALSKDLCSFLESNNITRNDLHPNDGAYTWFKLNEWMQVEILDELVKSLEHTPWYRFPFQEFMKIYFEVFQQQCGIVQEKYGMLQAYGSMPFLIDLVPGIVMTILFGQLKSFAIPLQIALPNGYDDDKSRFLEEVVLHLPLNLVDTYNCDNYLKSTLDKRILRSEPLPGNLIVCTLPTFKTMGEILEKFAIRFPSSRVFQISNQFEVQVRVSLDRSQNGQIATVSQEEQYEADLQRILLIAGVELKMSYHYPNTMKGHVPTCDPPAKVGKTNYCLQVHCLALLDVFRICNLLPNHQVEQVYDFYN